MEQNSGQTKEFDVEAEIEKVRKQERDKLYPEIQKLKGELAEKIKEMNDGYIKHNDLEKALKSKDKEIADLNVKLEKAKDEGKLEMSTEMEALQKELNDYKAKLAKAEKDFADYKNAEDVKNYRAEKLKDIDTEFQSLVKGDTKEAIDASYEEVKSLQISVKEKYGKKETLPNPKGDSNKTTSFDELVKKFSNMSDDEYREARKFKKK